MKRRIKHKNWRLQLRGKTIDTTVENWNICSPNLCPRCRGMGAMEYGGKHWRIWIPCKVCGGKGTINEATH